MKKVIVFCIVGLLLPFFSVAQTEGEKLFSTICVACHTVGGGRLVGPDLKDVDKKVSDKWMKAFIKSSQTVVKSGDKTAVALFAEYGSIVMPDQPTFTDDQISSLIAYIKSKGTPKEATAEKDPKAKTDTASTAAASANPPASNATASAPAAAAPVATASTENNDGSSFFSEFSSTTFWFLSGFFILMIVVVFALSNTIISMTKIIAKTKGEDII